MAGTFRLGTWLVEPSLNFVLRNGVSIHLTPKVMGVLVCLAEHAGDAVSKEVLLETVWPDTFVGDDVLKGYISDLRRVLEDDAREPEIIQTIPKTGYRLIAPVEWIKGTEFSTHGTEKSHALPGNHRKLRMAALVVIFAVVPFVLVLSNVRSVRSWLTSSAATPQIHSLAVLPLRSLSSDPNQEYFSDGLTDALITDLAQIGSIKVISHTSTMQYKNTEKSLREIARELNVDGIVEGTVQRSGDRVRISAQLIHGPSDKHVWANSYERDMRDVFLLERDVTQDVVSQIQSRLASPGQRSLTQPRPVEPKVLEAYLQGNYHLGLYGEGSGQEEQMKAAGYFQQAIDADPNFAPAYVGLATAHIELLIGSSEDVALRKKSLERAIEIDPNNPDARTWLGWLKWQPLLDWQGAESEFRRAIALNPSNTDAHRLLCLLLVTLGRVNEGLAEGRLAQQLDPNHSQMSLALYMARDYDNSIALIRMMLQRDPNAGELHNFLGNNYTKKGMQKEAVQELAKSYELFGESKVADHIRHAYEVAGYRGAIQAWANEVEHLQATRKAFLPGNLATAYAILGDKDRAFFWLEQAYEHREMVSADGGVFFLPAEPMYDPLRSDPRFKDLLRRIGLPP